MIVCSPVHLSRAVLESQAARTRYIVFDNLADQLPSTCQTCPHRSTYPATGHTCQAACQDNKPREQDTPTRAPTLPQVTPGEPACQDNMPPRADLNTELGFYCINLFGDELVHKSRRKKLKDWRVRVRRLSNSVTELTVRADNIVNDGARGRAGKVREKDDNDSYEERLVSRSHSTTKSRPGSVQSPASTNRQPYSIC